MPEKTLDGTHDSASRRETPNLSSPRAMSSPSSPGSSSHPTGPNGIPLRETCDPCHIAKVKCEGQWKVCRRCRVRGFYCEYSESRRGHGKRKSIQWPITPPTPVTPSSPRTPSAVRNSASDAAGHSAARPRSATSIPAFSWQWEAAVAGVEHPGLQGPTTTPLDRVLKAPGTYDPGGIMAASLPVTTVLTGLDLLSSTQTTQPATECVLMPTEMQPIHGMAPTAFANLAGFANCDATVSNLLQPNTETTTTGCTCFVACTYMLQQLNTTTSSLSHPLPVLDSTSIIRLAQEALSHCERMLACEWCIKPTIGSPTTAMLLATLLGNVGGLYISEAARLTTSPSNGGQIWAITQRAALAPDIARFGAVCEAYQRAFTGPAYEGGVIVSLVIFLQTQVLTLRAMVG